MTAREKIEDAWAEAADRADELAEENDDLRTRLATAEAELARMRIRLNHRLRYSPTHFRPLPSPPRSEP